VRLAVIPARAGSKRIPGKNIAPFHGRPMLGWAIAAARQSGCFDKVIVSTDDDAIAAIAREQGAETPFLRPAELADDHTGLMDVMAHALTAVDGESEIACCILPTAVMITPQRLREGLDVLLADPELDYVLSAQRYPHPIERALRRDAAGRVVMDRPEHLSTRTQDLPERYYDSGQFYWGRAAAWRAKKPVFTARSSMIVLAGHEAVDIDTPDDLARAERLFALTMQDGA